VKRVEFVSDRLSYIVLRGRWRNIIVVNVHAPSEERSDESKDSFYEELEQVFDHFPKYHTKILFGDFNAKVGRESIFKPTIGQESFHQDSNDNGVILANFATLKNLVVKSTMFPHRNIHKYTWTSSDGKTHNQIGHILIDRRWHSSVLDMRSFRGAYCDTDHYLVIAKVREILAVGKQAAQKFDRQRCNLRKLNEPEVREQCQTEITNRFAALENLNDDEDVNRTWENIKEYVQTSAKDSLGLQESKQKKPWFDVECLGFLDQRKRAKMQWIQDPSQSNVDNLNNVRREVRRHFRNKKKACLRAKIEELETNSKIQNIRDLYKGIRYSKKGYQPRFNIVKDEKGDLVADSHSIVARWRNYFSKLFSAHGAKDVGQAEIHTAEQLVPEPSASEFELAIENLKSHKSPSIDQIPAELIKAGGRTICLEIHKLITSIWKKEKLP